MFLKELSRERSKTMSTPWQPLKQVETMERYFSCPAVSQMQSLAGWFLRLMFLILKSMVVTCVSFSARKSPSVNRQKRAVLPTLLSPTMMTLYLFQSLLLDKYRSSIIIITTNNTNNYSSFPNTLRNIHPKPTIFFLCTMNTIINQSKNSVRRRKKNNDTSYEEAVLRNFYTLQLLQKVTRIHSFLQDSQIKISSNSKYVPKLHKASFSRMEYKVKLHFSEQFSSKLNKMVAKTKILHPNSKYCMLSLGRWGDLNIHSGLVVRKSSDSPQDSLQKCNPVLTIQDILATSNLYLCLNTSAVNMLQLIERNEAQVARPREKIVGNVL